VTASTAVDREVVLVGGEELVLRRVHGVDEYHQCEQLQSEVWGPDDIARVPLLDLTTAQDNGGFVLGAFRCDRRLVGFVYSFPGLSHDGTLKQCSVLLAVSGRYRRQGLGHRLKRFQARLATAHGFPVITWTMDPLCGRNAVFNLNKLGAVGTSYVVNAYGVGMGLNAGLETDRLLVAWSMPPAPPADPAADGPARYGPPVNRIVQSRHGLPVPAGHSLDGQAPRLCLDVPFDIYAVSRVDRGLAGRWREVSRDLFDHYVTCGYQAVGVREIGDGRCRYRLRREGP
jgi:predicted GNAT superfamily acetyltransferase